MSMKRMNVLRCGTARYGLVLLLAAAALCVCLAGWVLAARGCRGHTEAAGADRGGQVWTCSMHPQIRAAAPGKCPLCGMDLVQVTPSDPAKLVLTPGEARLAGVEVAPAARREVRTALRLTGKVDYDETRLRQITARFPGRIDKLHASCCPSVPDAPAPPPDPSRAGLPPLAGPFVGNVVAEGAPLADIFSPELLAAQEELLAALRLAGPAVAGKPAPAGDLAVRTVEATRGKLALLGLAPAQIAEIEKAGKAGEHVTVTAPLAGTITMKRVSVGDYVAVGAPMFT
nr:efflux RND transporter periplasmic adaptor subunit [Planctomycetota bacterium]